MIKSLKNISIICAISSIFFLGCTQDEHASFPKQSGEIPDQEARNIVISSSLDGILEYKLKANYMQKFIKRNFTIADTAEITSYKKDGTIKTVLTCDKAELDDTNNVFIGIGNVIVISENAILKTPYLRWDRNSDEFWAKDGVTILQEGNEMHGEKMHSDALMNTIEITKVSAEGQFNEKNIDW